MQRIYEPSPASIQSLRSQIKAVRLGSTCPNSKLPQTPKLTDCKTLLQRIVSKSQILAAKKGVDRDRCPALRKPWPEGLGVCWREATLDYQAVIDVFKPFGRPSIDESDSHFVSSLGEKRDIQVGSNYRASTVRDHKMVGQGCSIPQLTSTKSENHELKQTSPIRSPSPQRDV